MPVPPPPEGFDALNLKTLSPNEALQIGVDLFNDEHFWYAHEVWESAWAQIVGDQRILYQALIQFAAALHHAQQGNRHGFHKLLDRASSTLGRISADETRLNVKALADLLDHSLATASGNGNNPILPIYPRLPKPQP